MSARPASALALCLAVAFPILVFGLGPVLLRRRTGSRGWVRGVGATRGERVANGLFVLGCGLEVANPALVLAGVLEPARRVAHGGTQAIATVLWFASAALALLSQRHMGHAWRTGIEPDRPVALVTTGPFARVRNPVYTAMLGNSLALALLVPTIVAVFALVFCAAALQIQTRLVEEPHLRSLHGANFETYAGRVGRFLPHVGTLPS